MVDKGNIENCFYNASGLCTAYLMMKDGVILQLKCKNVTEYRPKCNIGIKRGKSTKLDRFINGIRKILVNMIPY